MPAAFMLGAALPAKLFPVFAAKPGISIRSFYDPGTKVSLKYGSGIRIVRENVLAGYFNPGGWRMSWNGEPIGTGQIVIGLVEAGLGERHGHEADVFREVLEVGVSETPSVVESCGTEGLERVGMRLPDRHLGGHRWTAYRNGDAGMNQGVATLDLRSVIDGTCYAITRATYTARGVVHFPQGLPQAGAASGRIDAALESIRIGRVLRRTQVTVER